MRQVVRKENQTETKSVLNFFKIRIFTTRPSTKQIFSINIFINKSQYTLAIFLIKLFIKSNFTYVLFSFLNLHRNGNSFLNDFTLTLKFKQRLCLRACTDIINTRNQSLSKKVVRKFVPPMVHLSSNAVTIKMMHKHILVLLQNPNKSCQMCHATLHVF